MSECSTGNCGGRSDIIETIITERWIFQVSRRALILATASLARVRVCHVAGSRLINRMLRQHALNNGLSLSAHALQVTQPDKPLILRDHTTGRVVRVPAEGQACPVEVPYEFLKTEKDILYLLGGCTDAFFPILDPRNRNA